MAAALDPYTKLHLASVVIMVVVVIFVMIFVVILVVVTIAIAVAWRLELAIFAHVTIAGQYFPFIRFARLKPCQLKRMMGAAARMIGRLPGLIAARHAIAHMVGAGGAGGPVDHG